MCLLVILTPSLTSPLIICNNRDEYFIRPTSRGSVSEDCCYFPTDEEKGGSWICLSGKLGRFAVVLNFHSWRYDIRDPVGPLLSRGLLTTEFINAPEQVNAEDYATCICKSSYRHFNLILGDSTGVFFLTSVDDERPLRMVPGHWFGISNGRLGEWEKVRLSTKYISEYVESSEINNKLACLSVNEASTLASSVLDLMSDTAPLSDHTFGHSSDLHMNLSAIFVPPVPRKDEDGITKLFGTRTTTIVVSCFDHGHANDSTHEVAYILERAHVTTDNTWVKSSFTIPYLKGNTAINYPTS